MAKCGHCRQRKAKRACPARRDEICPLCCGRIRNRDVACPAGCAHLSAHRPYQERRILERRVEAGADARPEKDDPLRDERLAWLAVHVEAPLVEASGRRPEFTDGDLILALEDAKERLVRGRGRVILPGVGGPAGNPLGEAVFLSLENCRYERSVVLAAGTGGYTTEEKTYVLERLLAAARSAARSDDRGRAYVERLRKSFAQLNNEAGASKIILPG